MSYLRPSGPCSGAASHALELLLMGLFALESPPNALWPIGGVSTRLDTLASSLQVIAFIVAFPLLIKC